MKSFAKTFSIFFSLIILVQFGVVAIHAQDKNNAQKPVATSAKPNIIIIMLDDMGFSDISSFGSEIPTPNIDRLAQGGMRFSQFYNASRCCPSRAALLTGLYPHQAGMGSMVVREGKRGSRPEGAYQGYLSRNAVTIAEVLRSSGYATFMSGKWHVGEDSIDFPTKRGFERYYGLISGAASHFEATPGRIMLDQETRISPQCCDFYMTDAMTDKACGFIQQHTAKQVNTPFFLYLAYTAPHYPLHAKESHVARFRALYKQGWDVIRTKRLQNMKRLGIVNGALELIPRDSAVPAWSSLPQQDKESWAEMMAVYAAMMASVDDGIGNLVAALKRSKQLENTVIMFLSDNGASHETLGTKMAKDLKDSALVARARAIPVGKPGSYTSYGKHWAHVSNTPFRMYKHWVHEGGIATPFIVFAPKIIPKSLRNRTNTNVGHIIDLMPTCLDLAQSQYPRVFAGNTIQALEGKSLVPLLKNMHSKKAQSRHEYIAWEHEGNKALRKGDWKIVSRDGGTWELYDVAKDRIETRNLAKNNPQILQELSALYEAWAKRIGVQAPLQQGSSE
jgi:arylsulfatase